LYGSEKVEKIYRLKMIIWIANQNVAEGLTFFLYQSGSITAFHYRSGHTKKMKAAIL